MALNPSNSSSFEQLALKGLISCHVSSSGDALRQLFQLRTAIDCSAIAHVLKGLTLQTARSQVFGRQLQGHVEPETVTAGSHCAACHVRISVACRQLHWPQAVCYTRTHDHTPCSWSFNPFNASCSKLLLLEGFGAIHDFELPDRTTELKNKNIFMRMLFQQRGCSAGLCVSQS